MTLVWRPGFQFDADASTYIEAVEAADTQALETGVRYAINDFVVGCKNDGIWDAIKACCILAGARTLAGALVPLVGTAPTNYNFVSGDYNRETGLVGDGSTKYLDSNRNNNADPINSQHMVIYASTVNNGNRWYMGAGVNTGGTTHIFSAPDNTPGYRGRSSIPDNPISVVATGLIGMSRSASASFNSRNAGTTSNIGRSSQTPFAGNIFVYLTNGSSTVYSNARLAFYSIGESLDLAALDTRVSNLITAIGAAIP